MEARQEVTPMQVRETRVYLPNNAGGFDLRGCPNAEELAAFIGRACNSFDDLVEALQAFMALDATFVSTSDEDLNELADAGIDPAKAVKKARAALAKATGAA